MSDPVIYGANSATIIPQSNFRAVGNEQGEFTATQDFKVLPEFVDSIQYNTFFLEGRPATDMDPSLPLRLSFLKLTFANPGREDGGWMVVTANFKGYFSNQFDLNNEDGVVPTYTLSGTLEEVSIMEHPKIVALAAGERALLNALVEGTAAWDIANSKIGEIDNETGAFRNWISQGITTADGILFAGKIAKGLVTYKRPVFTWTENKTEDTQFTAADLNDLGTISTPAGSPPAVNGTRDWMLTDAQSVQNGITNPIYNKARTWTLSERGGHDSDIYST